MEKRALLAVILSFVVLFFYSQFFVPKPTPESIQLRNQQTETAPDTETGQTAAGPSPSPTRETPETPETNLEYAAVAATSDDLLVKEIIIESDHFVAHVSNKGGVLTRFTLKNYRDSVKEDSIPYEMVRQLPNITYYPLTLLFQNTTLTTSFQKGAYETDAEQDFIHLDAGQPTFSVNFTRTDGSGVAVSKTLTFHHDSFLIDVDLLVRNQSNSVTNTSWSLVCSEGIGPEGFEESRYIHAGPIFLLHERNKDDLEELKTKDLDSGERTFKTGLKWAGISSSYFFISLIPPPQHTLYGTAWNAQKQISTVALKSSRVDSMPGYEEEFKLHYYIGPKQRNQLENCPQNLLSIIDYGVFSIIALPLFKVLTFFHGYMHSWGLAIIALTILIKLLFYPLTRSSFQSMEKMKLVQPEMNEIRSKYKDDPNRMNKEVWALYKKHKVNPMGSCFPMLLQIPVFFALYNVLYVSIELRHTRFLYIPDLSAYDPFYISPILMGASMVLQQHFTPVMGDPKQAQIMKLMPVIFTVMFIYFPSGLVIYWLVNNIISIGQQLLIMRKSKETRNQIVQVEEPGKKSRKKKGQKNASQS